MNSTNGCCEKCKEYREAPDGGGSYYVCVKSTCPCHTKPTGEGEKSVCNNCFDGDHKDCAEPSCQCSCHPEKERVVEEECKCEYPATRAGWSCPHKYKRIVEGVYTTGFLQPSDDLTWLSDAPYNQRDHYHCWQEEKPPCGQRVEHLKCCLCEMLNPKIEALLSAQREEMREAIEKLRRTDDTQMNADHVYDEALDDVLSLLSQKKVDKE